MRKYVLAMAAAIVASAVFSFGSGRVHAESGGPAPYNGTRSEVYFLDKQTAALRTGISGADTLTKAAILATPEFVLDDSTGMTSARSTIVIGGRFSASGATCAVQVVRIYKNDHSATSTSTSANTIKGYSSTVTLTASSSQCEGSYYPAPDVVVDAAGAATCRVIITTAVSSGTVDLWVGSY